eukprot:819029-Prymnesium_polylepis.1
MVRAASQRRGMPGVRGAQGRGDTVRVAHAATCIRNRTPSAPSSPVAGKPVGNHHPYVVFF